VCGVRLYAGAFAGHSGSEGAVLDVIYIACAIAFFALMLAFVRGLEILGRDPALQDKERP
jgi:hypothetical protein